MNKSDLLWVTGIAVAFLIVGVVITTETFRYQQQHSAAIQNATSYGISLCQNSTYIQLVQQGRIPLCVPYQDRTYCGYAVTEWANFTEVQP